MKPYTLAVDLGATNVRAALVSSQGRIIHKIKDRTPKQGKDGRIISQTIAGMIEALLSAHPDIEKTHIAGIGISSMGPLDYRRGGPLHSPNIPYAFVPLVAPLQKKIRMPVHLLNDANAAVVGEQYFGAGKKKKNLIYVTISTGIGAGVIMDNHLLLGKSGNAAEIGHTAVDSAYRLACTCARGTGHWEGYASGRNIPRFFDVWIKKTRIVQTPAPQEAKDIFNRAAAGDPISTRFLDELHKINARAVSNLIVSYDPEIITIGGSVMLQNRDVLINGIRKYVDTYLPVPPIRATPLGEDITLLGAAAAALK